MSLIRYMKVMAESMTHSEWCPNFNPHVIHVCLIVTLQQVRLSVMQLRHMILLVEQPLYPLNWPESSYLLQTFLFIQDQYINF